VALVRGHAIHDGAPNASHHSGGAICISISCIILSFLKCGIAPYDIFRNSEITSPIFSISILLRSFAFTYDLVDTLLSKIIVTTNIYWLLLYLVSVMNLR